MSDLSSTFRRQLAKLLEENNVTQSELAGRLDVSNSAVNNWLLGNNMPRMDKIDKIASIFNIPRSVLIGDSDNNIDYTRYGLIPVTKHKIPVLGTVAAGSPIFADEDLETYIDPQDVDADFALHVKGNSMIGDGINNNDVVYVRKQGVIGQGEIAVVLVEDEATLKHVYTADGEIQLVASNPSYPPIIIRDSDHKNVSILGKAVGVYRTLNSQTKGD